MNSSSKLVIVSGLCLLVVGVCTTQAETVGSAPEVFVQATPSGGSVGVQQNFSSWSDLTAMFRPSRWKNPIAEGGSLSWLNYNAWASVPGRTGKVLLGEAAVAGVLFFIIDASNNDDDHRHRDWEGRSSSGSSGTSSGTDSSNDGGEMPF